MTEAELKDRTKAFALRVMTLIQALPAGLAGSRVGDQLLRSGMSVGVNYRAACRARSHRDFASKIGIAEEEADESAYWLELIIEGGLLKRAKVEELHREAVELQRILTASRKTAQSRSRVSSIQNPQSKIKNTP